MGPESRRMWEIAGKYTAVGIEMAIAVAIGAIGGQWLDKRLGTAPWLLYIGIIVGFGAATQTVLRVVRAYRRDTAERRSPEGGPTTPPDGSGD